jgi:hypothetical protein
MLDMWIALQHEYENTWYIASATEGKVRDQNIFPYNNKYNRNCVSGVRAEIIFGVE